MVGGFEKAALMDVCGFEEINSLGSLGRSRGIRQLLSERKRRGWGPGSIGGS